MTKIHFLQHVPFETPGYLETLATIHGCSTSTTCTWEQTAFPDPSEIELLIILGGPMNIYEHDRYPWLMEETKFITKAMKADIKIIGICLGSQLLADVLGATVIKNRYKEIGWFPVKLSQDALDSPLLKDFPEQPTPFHWHGDTYPIPPGAIRLGSSEACDNQGFIFDDRIAALQFHLEMAPHNLQSLVQNCGNELKEDDFIQTADTIRAESEKYMELSNYLMKQLFSNILKM